MYWLRALPSRTRENSQLEDCLTKNYLRYIPIRTHKAVWSLAEDGIEEGGTENPSGTGIAGDTSKLQYPHPSSLMTARDLALGTPLSL